jgi:hypothetical protein
MDYIDDNLEDVVNIQRKSVVRSLHPTWCVVVSGHVARQGL